MNQELTLEELIKNGEIIQLLQKKEYQGIMIGPKQQAIEIYLKQQEYKDRYLLQRFIMRTNIKSQICIDRPFLLVKKQHLKQIISKNNNLFDIFIDQENVMLHMDIDYQYRKLDDQKVYKFAAHKKEDFTQQKFDEMCQKIEDVLQIEKRYSERMIYTSFTDTKYSVHIYYPKVVIQQFSLFKKILKQLKIENENTNLYFEDNIIDPCIYSKSHAFRAPNQSKPNVQNTLILQGDSNFDLFDIMLQYSSHNIDKKQVINLEIPYFQQYYPDKFIKQKICKITAKKMEKIAQDDNNDKFIEIHKVQKLKKDTKEIQYNSQIIDKFLVSNNDFQRFSQNFELDQVFVSNDEQCIKLMYKNLRMAKNTFKCLCCENIHISRGLMLIYNEDKNTILLYCYKTKNVSQAYIIDEQKAQVRQQNLQIYAENQGFKYVEQDTKYLQLPKICQNQGEIVFIKSDTGSGKSLQLLQIVENEKQRYLYIGCRISMKNSLYARLSPEKLKKYDYQDEFVQDMMNSIKWIGEKHSILFCNIDSVSKIENINAFSTIIIDEAVSCQESIMKQNLLLLKLQKITQIQKIILMDALLEQENIQFYIKTIQAIKYTIEEQNEENQSQITVFNNIYIKPQEHFLVNYNSSKISQKQTLIALFLQLYVQKKLEYITISIESYSQGLCIIHCLIALGIKKEEIMYLNGEQDGELKKQIFENLNQIIEKDAIKIVIYTQTVSVGVSIEDSKFLQHISIFTGINTQAFDQYQMIHRSRKCQTFYHICNFQKNEEDDSKQILKQKQNYHHLQYAYRFKVMQLLFTQLQQIMNKYQQRFPKQFISIIEKQGFKFKSILIDNIDYEEIMKDMLIIYKTGQLDNIRTRMIQNMLNNGQESQVKKLIFQQEILQESEIDLDLENIKNDKMSDKEKNICDQLIKLHRTLGNNYKLNEIIFQQDEQIRKEVKKYVQENALENFSKITNYSLQQNAKEKFQILQKICQLAELQDQCIMIDNRYAIEKNILIKLLDCRQNIEEKFMQKFGINQIIPQILKDQKRKAVKGEKIIFCFIEQGSLFQAKI